MTDHLREAKQVRGEIQEGQYYIHEQVQGWQKILVKNLQSLSRMLTLMYNYLQEQIEPDVENLANIRENIHFIERVFQQDVFIFEFELTSEQPMNKSPKQWVVFINQAKELVNKPYWDVLDELDNYIKLLEQKEELDNSDRTSRWTLATFKKNIRAVQSQRRSFIDVYIVFMRRLASMASQLR